MGAAIRHAGSALGSTRRDRRVILMLTDGEPDIDAPDPAYLVHDARHAVAEQRRRGIHVLAVSLDPAGQSYAGRVFGPGGYWVVDRLSRLPQTLPLMYARLAR
jgi:nitric oxide reductase activation protein